MQSISFTNFRIKKGLVKFNYAESEGNSGELYYKLTPKIKLCEDLIALTIPTLCGKKYSKIHVDLRISGNITNVIRNYTGADVTVNEITPDTAHSDKISGCQKKNGITLNFSGGFDSLSAMYLCPAGTNLVSLDFGGRFRREYKFFKNYKTHMVKTNLLEKGFNKNVWSFMGIAAILYSDVLKDKYIVFGSILGESISTLYRILPDNLFETALPFDAIGLTRLPYTLGLTDVGTIKLLAHYAPKKVSKSLRSLANPWETKGYRKYLLARICEKREGINFKLTDSSSEFKKVYFKFGQNLVSDFLSFWIIKNMGEESAARLVSDIPKEVLELSQKLGLDFYERLNPFSLENFPDDLREHYLSRLNEAGIVRYTEKDWDEFNQVRSLLSRYYDIR